VGRTLDAPNRFRPAPLIRAAAERFESETSRRLDDNCPPGPVDERMVELFLILNGYAPYKLASASSSDSDDE
jgi:hypothetical protein